MPCWYYDKEGLQKTPSIQDGIDYNTECRYRKQGARFITEIGSHMELGYNTMATAVVYFHRFYMFHSFKTFPRYVTACCCLFLAGKVEETPKKCRDIIKVAESLLSKEIFSSFGEDPKEEVMILEKILLQTIKFDLKVQHPYNYLLRYAKGLKGDKHKLQKMVQMAWTFINDSLCTTLSIQWEPEIIAIAVMYLAGKLTKFKVMNWSGRKPQHIIWWDAYVLDLKMNVVEDICHQVLDLYSPETREASVSPLAKPSKKKIKSEKVLKSKEEPTTNTVSTFMIDSKIYSSGSLSPKHVKVEMTETLPVDPKVAVRTTPFVKESQLESKENIQIIEFKTEISTPRLEPKTDYGATPPLPKPKDQSEVMPPQLQSKLKNEEILPLMNSQVKFEEMPLLLNSNVKVEPLPLPPPRDPRAEVAATISTRDPRIETAIALATAQAIPWAPMMALPKTPSSVTPDSVYSPSKPLPNFPSHPDHFSFSNHFIESANNHCYMNSPAIGCQNLTNSFIGTSTNTVSGNNNWDNSMMDCNKRNNNWDNSMMDCNKRNNNSDNPMMDCNKRNNNWDNPMMDCNKKNNNWDNSINNRNERFNNWNPNKKNGTCKYDDFLISSSNVIEEDWDNPSTDGDKNSEKCDYPFSEDTKDFTNNSLLNETKDITNDPPSKKIKGNWDNPLTDGDNSDFLNDNKGFSDSNNDGWGFRKFDSGGRGFNKGSRGFGNFDNRGQNSGNFDDNCRSCGNCGFNKNDFRKRRSFGYSGNRRRNNFSNIQNDRFGMQRDSENSDGKFSKDGYRDEQSRSDKFGPMRNHRKFN